MKAMVLKKIGQPLEVQTLDVPEPSADQVLIKTLSCGVCRTDLHIVDGDLPESKLPLILGHQVVGIIEKVGSNAKNYSVGTRVGIPWLGKSCQQCAFCTSQRENLCDDPTFTGYNINGGYAEYCVAHSDYIFALPDHYDDIHTAPLLCAGLIGYRAFRLLGDVQTIGFYGFGSSAHLLIQVANYLKKEIYVFTRPGDKETQAFAKELGAKWAGGSDENPPIMLDASILFAPVGELYINALKCLKKGGTVISAGIHMSDIPSFPYSLLWEERIMTSVANLTREDGKQFFELISKVPLKIKITTYPLEKANEALGAIRDGSLEGSAVLTI